MKHLTKILWVMLFLTGCHLQAVGSTPLSVVDTPTSSSKVEQAPESTLTATLESKPTSTWTAAPQPNSTLTPVLEIPTSTPGSFINAQPLVSGESLTITEVRMVDLKLGWGLGYQGNSGDHILYTEDGGYTWDDRTPPDPLANQPDETGSALAHFLDPNHSWVIYASKKVPPALQEKLIWRTTDAGLTWNASDALESDGMEDAFIPGAFTSVGVNDGWLLVHVGAGMSHDYSYLYHTGDGGSSWERIVDPSHGGIQGLHNTGMAFADVDYGWVSKDNLGVMPGAFFEQSNDGGNTWEQVFLPQPPELDWFNDSSLCETSQATFTSDQHGMLIVKCRLPGDYEKNIEWSLTYIYRTDDRSQNWQYSRLQTAVDQLVFLSEDLGWAFGRDLYRTTDGGVTWEMFKSVNWDGGFTFVDPNYGWAVAQNEGEIALVMTEDGGKTWQIIEPKLR